MSEEMSLVESVEVDLDIGGMTCTSCAVRVEKKLNRLDGVEASVNYATETASIRFDPARVTVGRARRRSRVGRLRGIAAEHAQRRGVPHAARFAFSSLRR